VHWPDAAANDLIVTTANGDVLRNRNADDLRSIATAAIRQTGFTPHELRRTAARLAVSSGANSKQSNACSATPAPR
jgi:hypothetical protein